ncbi:MAG: hemerythrin domain-containing protein [Thioalkalivibrio sp.]|nr:MAG: hemerythrin domain-containing protein [Thioalkalivibrio sp.]
MPDDRPELEKLRREHEQALVLAERIAALAAEGSSASRAEAVQLVSDYYAQELEAHLQHEEQTMFAPLLKRDKAHFALCMRLGKDHGALRAIATGIHADTPADELDAFARILRDHTRLEDEEFLPLVAALFTPEEFEAVLNFTPLPTAATGNGNGH